MTRVNFKKEASASFFGLLCFTADKTGGGGVLTYER